ncbi:MAG: hypothetical protein WCJ35_22930 [Planctomycetota bacterium]
MSSLPMRVFGIAFLRRVREVETASDDHLAVDLHVLPTRNC